MTLDGAHLRFSGPSLSATSANPEKKKPCALHGAISGTLAGGSWVSALLIAGCFLHLHRDLAVMSGC